MLIYLCLALFPIFLGALFPKVQENRKQKAYFYLICGAVMLVTMGLRHYSLGSIDTQNYYNAMVRAIRSRTWSEYYEPDRYEVGIQAFMYILSRFFKDPQWLLISTSLLFITSIFYFVDRNSDDIPMSISIYISFSLFAFHLQGMRQSIAMCICLFAYEQAKKRKFIPFLAIIAVAVLFHKTAILFLPVYYICRMRCSNKTIGAMLAISAAVLLFASEVTAIANFLFDTDYGNPVESGGIITLMINILIIALILFADSDIKKGNERTPLLFLLMLSTLCYAFRYVGANLAERVAYYFIFSQMVLIPRTSKIVVAKQRGLYKMIVLALSIAFFAYHLSGTTFVPYRFFWQG